MDNYDFPNLPLSGHCADSGEHHSWLTDEENRRAACSGRSATVSTSGQVEQQQLPSTGDEQISKQRVLADFDISLLPNTSDRATFDKPEDPFASLAAYRPLTSDDNPQHPSVSELGLGSGFLEGFTAEDLTDLAAEDFTDVVLAEPEGNDILKLPEQSQGESDTACISIPESAIPDTDTDKRSGKRRAPEPRNLVIGDLPESVIKESSRRSDRLSKKRQKLVITDTEFLPLPRGTATESQVATMPEKSAAFRKNIKRQDPDKSLRKRVNEETNKWIVKREGLGLEKRFMCSYPDCSLLFSTRGNLREHIFGHIHISLYKCPYPECADNPYFRSSSALTRHVQSYHKKEQPYHCTLCDRRFMRSDNCKRHMRLVHNLAV